MAYPTFIQTQASSEDTEDKIAWDEATDGSERARILWSSEKTTFSVVHELTTADVATLKAFYTVSRGATFDFVWARDGATYTCRFKGEPSYKPMGGDWWKASVKLRTA